MLAEIATGWQSLKAAKDIVQGLNALENVAAVNEVKVTLQSHILEAQQSLFAAQDAQTAAAKRISDLEEQIMQLKDWSRQAESYELVAIGNGGFAYMQKEGMRTTEPPHWLCANCFTNRKKSILQRQGTQGERERPWTCPNCRAGIQVHFTRKPEYAES
jgi:rubrerythrin